MEQNIENDLHLSVFSLVCQIMFLFLLSKFALINEVTITIPDLN